MKTKKFNKKLVLNKQTVADLRSGAMEAVRGGVITGRTDCRTECVTDCIACPSMIQSCYCYTVYLCETYQCWTFDCTEPNCSNACTYDNKVTNCCG